MTAKDYRTERDSMGEVRVPAGALWGAQTQRAVDNFKISALRMPRGLIRSLALIKWAAAGANAELGLLDPALAEAIRAAALEIVDGGRDEHFPVDVFQTGSGTSTNMNANEVIARLASDALGRTVHPNDHVNMGQSSNDVVPSAIHLSAAIAVKETLLPALHDLVSVIEVRIADIGHIVKTGRTHLMDAMPITLGQELGGWRAQLRSNIARLESTLPRLLALALGATAVGTGVNTHPEFARRAITELANLTGLALTASADPFEALASQDTAVELSGQLRTLAVSLMKIANDLRWMNSGPLTGLAEITLPALQPGSSIMPGKVNPVIPEAVAMVAAQVIGNDATCAVAGQSGNFQLNVMLPVIAYNLLQSIELLAAACRTLAQLSIAGFTVQEARLSSALEHNPVLVTALNPRIGYEQAAAIAKRAYAEGRPIREVAREMSGLTDRELDELLDPKRLTRGGIGTGGAL